VLNEVFLELHDFNSENKIMKYYSLLILLLLAGVSFGQTKSINFEKSSWDEIKAKAKKENKLIFLDAYASWCGPCKWMAANTFTNDAVADFFNENFVNAKINMEVGEGKLIRGAYMVSAYPTLLFIHSDGNQIHRRSGALPPEGLITLGKTALDSTKQLKTFVDRFKGGDRSDEFIVEYLGVLKACGMQMWSDSIFAGYLRNKKGEELLKPVVWKTMIGNLKNRKMAAFNYVVKNEKSFSDKFGADTVDLFVSGMYLGALQTMLYSRTYSKVAYDELLLDVKNSEYSGTEKIVMRLEMTNALINKDYSSYETICLKFMEKYSSEDADVLNQMAWTFFEVVDNKESLEKALAWSLKSIKLKSVDASYDTAAMLYFKLGNKERAIYYENQAINLARLTGNFKAVKELEENLKKIQELK